MDVPRTKSNRRPVRLVVADFRQRCPPRGNRVAAGDQVSVCQVGHAYGRATTIRLHQAVAPDDDAVPCGPGGNVVLHADQMAGQPESVAVHTKVLHVGSQIGINGPFITQLKRGTDRANRDIARHRADFVARFRVIGGTRHVVGHIVDEVHMRSVVHKPIPRTPHHHTAGHHSRCARGRCAAAVEVDRIPPSDVGPCARRRRKHDTGAGRVTHGVFREIKVDVIQRS